MSPSRRQFVGAVGAVAALAGCSTFDSATETETPQSVSPAIRARLQGPETDQLLFDGSDVVRVGEVNDVSGSVQLPLELSDAATTEMADQFRAANVAENHSEFEIQLLDEDGEVNRYGINAGLAEAIAAGEWDGEFVMNLEDREAAERLRSELLGEETEQTA